MDENVMIARQLAQQGLDAMNQGRLADAESQFTSAVEHCPNNTAARYQLANCLWQRGDREAAIRHLEEAIEISGHSDVDMLVELAYMQANLGRLDLSLPLAEEAVRLAPERAIVWQLLGDIRRETGEWQDALANYHRCLGYDGDNVEVQLSCVEVYHQLNRPSRMLATLHRLDEQIPWSHQPERLLVLKSIAYQRLKRYDEAIEVLTVARRRRSLSNDALIQLAMAQAAAGRSSEAQQTIRQAISTAQPSEQLELRTALARIAPPASESSQPTRY